MIETVRSPIPTSAVNTTGGIKPPELGLVCITASDKIRYRTITRKRLLQLAPEAQVTTLRSLYADNLKRLSTAIIFCHSENIRLYRMNSALLPFADEPVGEALVQEFAELLQQIGRTATELGIRLILHPEQFVVLNSDRPEVIANSIKILTTYARTLDLLGMPRSPWALMNIHGGKGNRVERLIQVIRELPDAVRLRLTLENDEYTYSATEIAEICKAAGVPMVFDAHHHAIHEHLETYDDPSVAELLAIARTTWEHPDWQVVHISNGRNFFTDPQHSDLITKMPIAYWNAPWIEIEAKRKEEAIARLRQEWLPLQPVAQQHIGRPEAGSAGIAAVVD